MNPGRNRTGRTYASIKLAIWGDGDWRLLTPQAKLLYLAVLTSPTMQFSGIADWHTARLAYVTGLTHDEVLSAGEEMRRSLHLVIDDETEEVLVRSYLRHDGLMDRGANFGTAVAKAYRAAVSMTLQEVLVHEMRRLNNDAPGLSAWGSKPLQSILNGAAATDPRSLLVDSLQETAAKTPEVTPEVTPPVSASTTPPLLAPTPTPTPDTNALPPSTDNPATKPNPKASSTDVDADFDEWWKSYPRKVGKGAAKKAYAKARKKAGAQTLADSLAAILPAWQRLTDKTFIPHPSTWLNEERWDDDVEDAQAAPSNEQPGRRLPTVQEIDAAGDAPEDPAAYREWYRQLYGQRS